MDHQLTPAAADTGGDGPFVQITRFDVSCFPVDDEEHGHFRVMVEYRGRDLWAVINGFGQCLNTDGTWVWERRPSEREDEWLATVRFTMSEAIRHARGIAPQLTVNGWTVQAVKDAREKDIASG